MQQQEVSDTLRGVGAVITDSHVVLASQKHATAYVNKDAVYPHTRQTSRLCRAMAEQFAGEGVEAVVGPAVGGVILSQWTAHHLADITGRDVLAVYAEKDEETVYKASEPTTVSVSGKEITLQTGEELVVRKPRFVIKRGYDKLLRGRQVLVVEDVLTTGGSAKKVVEAAREVPGDVLGLVALCNRGGVKPEDVADPPRFAALLDVQLDSWTEEECRRTGPCSRNIPINTDVGHGREYLARQRAQQS